MIGMYLSYTTNEIHVSPDFVGTYAQLNHDNKKRSTVLDYTSSDSNDYA